MHFSSRNYVNGFMYCFYITAACIVYYYYLSTCGVGPLAVRLLQIHRARQQTEGRDGEILSSLFLDILRATLVSILYTHTLN